MAAFVDLTNDPQIPPPYQFTGVTARGFQTRGDGAKLQTIIDAMLNGGAPSPPFRWRLASTFVWIDLITYPSMTTSPATTLGGLGTVSQHELLFRVLVGRARSATAYLSGPRVAMFCPFIFVDNAWSMITGRDVIGYPKQMADFGSGDPSQYDADTVVRTHAFTQPHLPLEPLLEVEYQTKGGAVTPFSTALTTMAAVWSAADLNAGFVLDDLLELAGDAIQGRQHTVQLKQFRDDVYPDLACYRKVVEGRFIVTPLAGGMHPPPSHLVLHAYPGLDIAGTLGLQGQTNANGETTLVSALAYNSKSDMVWAV